MVHMQWDAPTAENFRHLQLVAGLQIEQQAVIAADVTLTLRLLVFVNFVEGVIDTHEQLHTPHRV